MALLNALAVLFYVALLARPSRLRTSELFIFAYGPEWAVWASLHCLAFGFSCSFQLYPLLLTPSFILLFRGLEPRMRLALIMAPLLLYTPALLLLWRLEPRIALSL